MIWVLQGTRSALYANGRESITVTVQEVTPRSVGALVALYERAVGIYASLVNVNAYHQPGKISSKLPYYMVLRPLVSSLRNMLTWFLKNSELLELHRESLKVLKLGVACFSPLLTSGSMNFILYIRCGSWEKSSRRGISSSEAGSSSTEWGQVSLPFYLLSIFLRGRGLYRIELWCHWLLCI